MNEKSKKPEDTASTSTSASKDPSAFTTGSTTDSGTPATDPSDADSYTDHRTGRIFIASTIAAASTAIGVIGSPDTATVALWTVGGALGGIGLQQGMYKVIEAGRRDKDKE